MAEENPHEAQEQEPTPTPTGAEEAPDIAEAEAALESVEQAAEAVEAAATGDAHAPDLPNFAGPEGSPAGASSGMSLLDDVSLRVKVELGRTMMYVEDVLRLNADSVIELDKAAGDPVDIYVNNRHVARGEVLVLNENFCVRASEIMDTAPTEEESSS